MVESIVNSKKEDFERVIERFQTELHGLRTGRAHPGLLATVQVEIYGNRSPVEHVASVSVSDVQTLTISPWDKSQIPAIEKGIQQANLGLNPSNDGNVIRITLPKLNEERRKELVKLLGTMTEQARIGIRQVREEVQRALKKAKDDKAIAEDDVTFGQKKLQDIVDAYNDTIKEIAGEKEKELMTV